MVRKRIIFIGDVQGVGFRYRSQYAASNCGVTGWVKNEWDGTVIMEAQGTEEQIERMIGQIQAGKYIDIRERKEKEIPLEESEYGFSIK